MEVILKVLEMGAALKSGSCHGPTATDHLEGIEQDCDHGRTSAKVRAVGLPRFSGQVSGLHG